MHVDIQPSMTIDTDQLNTQRDLIVKMVSELESGRTAFAIMRDKDTLSGILGMIDAVSDCIDPLAFDDDYEGPECPGCVDTGSLCDDCEYTADPDVDPACD